MDKNRSPIGVGVVTLCMVLMVLCLAVFSALTLASAQADLRLSQRNAETVSAYYRADWQAALRYAAFQDGGEEGEPSEYLPVRDTQELYLHLRRQGTGSVEILAWQLVPAWDAEQVEDPTLPVWDGGDSASYSSHPPKGAAAL